MTGRAAGDRGAGLLATTFGLAMFLGFVLFATQLTVNLLARTAVTAETLDAARRVARASVQTAGPDAVRAAQAAELARLRDRFSRFDPDPDLAFVDDPTFVVLTVAVDHPEPVLAGLDRALGLGTIERTVRVRREVPVP